MNVELSRALRIASLARRLVATATVTPRQVFNEVLVKLENHERDNEDPKKRILIVDSRPPALLHVNGYLRRSGSV